MNHRFRQARRRILQKIFLSNIGLRFIRIWRRLNRGLDYVVCNRSVDPETNGEQWLIQQLPEKPFVVDVGYNKGDFSKYLLSVRPMARILAFDPAELALRAWQKNFGEKDRVKFFQWAISNRSGYGIFTETGDGRASLAKNYCKGIQKKVSIRMLGEIQEIRKTPIDLLKIDAEGFDLNVLEGATRLLRKKWFRMILFEYADGWVANRRFLAEAARFLGDHKYQLFRLYPEFISPCQYSPAEERFDLGCMFVALPSPIRKRTAPMIRPDPFRQA